MKSLPCDFHGRSQSSALRNWDLKENTYFFMLNNSVKEAFEPCRRFSIDGLQSHSALSVLGVPYSTLCDLVQLFITS